MMGMCTGGQTVNERGRVIFFYYPLAITALKLSRCTCFMTVTQAEGSEAVDERRLLCFKLSFQH